LRAILRLKSKRGIDTIAAPSGFSYNLNSVFLVKEFPTLPKKGLSEARLPVNVYVIEYAAKLITTNLTTKFFNENFVKKIPTF
jgi:hypothetical protein